MDTRISRLWLLGFVAKIIRMSGCFGSVRGIARDYREGIRDAVIFHTRVLRRSLDNARCERKQFSLVRGKHSFFFARDAWISFVSDIFFHWTSLLKIFFFPARRANYILFRRVREIRDTQKSHVRFTDSQYRSLSFLPPICLHVSFVFRQHLGTRLSNARRAFGHRRKLCTPARRWRMQYAWTCAIIRTKNAPPSFGQAYIFPMISSFPAKMVNGISTMMGRGIIESQRALKLTQSLCQSCSMSQCNEYWQDRENILHFTFFFFVFRPWR